MKCGDPQKIILQFYKGQGNLNKILGTQKAPVNKEGISFNPFNNWKCYKNLFVE